MLELHPFYLYGANVSKAALLFCALSTIIVLHVRRAGRLRRHARSARATFPRTSGEEVLRAAEQDVCLGGTLVALPGAGKATLSDGEEAGGLALAVAGATLALVGRIHVVVGSRETSDRARRVLAPGDPVLVQARLVRCRGEAGYREAPGTLQLEPAAHERAVRVIATRAPRLIGVPTARRVGDAALGFLLGAVVLVGGGRLALGASRGAAPGDDDGVRTSPAALAAATPFHRQALAAAIAHLLHESTPPAPDETERLARAEVLLEQLGDCAGFARLDARRGDAERAVERAEACGVPAPAEALFATGRFAEASRAYRAQDGDAGGHSSPRAWLRRAAAHLAAHAYEDAARAVDAYAQAANDSSRDRAEALHCVSDALRTRGGDESSKISRTTGRAMCRVLYADLEPPEARPGILGDLTFVWTDNVDMHFAKLDLVRIAQGLLEEAEARGGLSSDAYRYGLYPEGYLAREHAAARVRVRRSTVFDMGNDVLDAEDHERTHLDEHPFAIFAALYAKGRGDGRDPSEARVHTMGHLALFLAATSDPEGAKGALARIADVPDAPPAEQRCSKYDGQCLALWRRPDVRAIARAVDALSHGPGVALDGLLTGPLAVAMERARTDPRATNSAARLRAGVLDRDIVVPMRMLDAFDRRHVPYRP